MTTLTRLIKKVLLQSLLLLTVSPSLFAASPLVLMTQEMPPYVIKQQGEITGASVDIIRALFQQAKLPYQIKILPWKRAYETAKNTPTCIFPVQRSQQREAEFEWISPVLISQTAFYAVGAEKTPLHSLQDAMAFSIGTYRGSAIEEYLLTMGFNVDSVSRDRANINKLLSGRIALWAADTLTAPYLLQQAKVDTVKPLLVYFTSLRALACHASVGKAAVNRLQQALKTLYTTGVIDEILSRYKALYQIAATRP
ncbi:transporter substrate-binding domain-containing protein [Thalassomonas sp. RHCl1]|uniref:substrate-binding periplasmic protein n=1 Tax=Thalassomonas sp. RHCl1 TaxID=2995320 RepID=UPI00248B3EDC|nr:transporter substrate-binding domain-containing protein [Thalassomonas sp. RHCl1]